MDLTKSIRNYLTSQIERTLNHLIASHHLDSLGTCVTRAPAALLLLQSNQSPSACCIPSPQPSFTPSHTYMHLCWLGPT